VVLVTVYVVMEKDFNRGGELVGYGLIGVFESAGDAQVARAGGRDRHIYACELTTKRA